MFHVVNCVPFWVSVLCILRTVCFRVADVVLLCIDYSLFVLYCIVVLFVMCIMYCCFLLCILIFCVVIG